MSKFRKASAALQLLCSELTALNTQLSQADRNYTELEHSDRIASCLQARLVELAVAVDDLVQLASETDPDTKVFGDAMVTKVRQLASEFALFKDAAQISIETARQQYLPVLQRKQQEQDAIQRQQAEEKKRSQRERRLAAEAEEERLKQWEEEIRKLAEATAKAEAVEREIKRKQYELDRDVRNAAKSLAAGEERRLANRREASKTMPLEAVLDILECNNPAPVYKRAVRALQDIVDNIVANPENAMFRSIKKTNAKIQSDLLNLDGGIEAMLCIGFAEQEADGTRNEFLLCLAEPALDAFDQWSAWFDKLQQTQALLQTVYSGLS